MSTVADFNRIDDCDKIDPLCVDAFSEVTLDEDGMLCVETSWGKQCVDLHQMVRDHESCTSLYLSPEEDPNCLVYEKEERCGDNDCIHGDDLSRIISLTRLKDVDQEKTPSDGDVYIFNGETGLFEPFNLKTPLGNIQVALQNIQATLNNYGNRLQNIETKLVPPTGAPDSAKIAWGTINLYSDHNAVVDSSGVATSLDKTHGLYTHDLSINAIEDELFG